MRTEKVSVSLDRTLLTEARRRIRGRATLSSYLNDALYRKLLAERHAEYLDTPDAQFGPITEEEAEAAKQWWDEIKAAV